MRWTILSIMVSLIVLGLAQVASAAVYGGFDITDLNVNDDTVKPGESFTVEIEVTNNISQDMEGIEVEVVISDIDDGDDLEDEGDMDDIESGDDDSIEFEFTVPYAVDEGSYDINITVRGTSSNDTDYEYTQSTTVDVKKDRHDVIFKSAPSLTQETLKCTRTTEVSTTLYDIGDKDEEIELTVYNTELGISQKQTFELEAGNELDDIKSTRTFSLDLKTAEAGSYTFYIKAAYDDANEQETQSFILKVDDCATAPKQPVVEEEEVSPQVPTTTTKPITVTNPLISVPAVVEQESFMEQYGSIMFLALAYIIVIVVGIVLVISLLRRR